MAVLTAPFDIGIKDGLEVRVKMAAVKIYQGGAVGVVLGTGYATPLLVATSGIKFIGVAEETVDNSAGSPGDKWIRVRRVGLAAFNNSGVTVADIGKPSYFVSGSDDNTVATTPVTVFAGTIAAVDSNGVVWVDITRAVGSIGTALTAQLTTLTLADAAGSPAYSIGAVTNSNAYGFASAQNAIDVLYVIKNLQARLAQVETALEGNGIVIPN